jgi:hypothetical protein
MRSFGSGVPLALSAFPEVPPFASTAPDTCRGSDLFQQGGCQQANLLAREAFASTTNLDSPARMSTLSDVTKQKHVRPFNEPATCQSIFK